MLNLMKNEVKENWTKLQQYFEVIIIFKVIIIIYFIFSFGEILGNRQKSN